VLLERVLLFGGEESKIWGMKNTLLVVCSLVAVSAAAEFKMDRKVMSQAYWDIWNEGVQKKIDADIEKYRKTDASVEVAAPAGTVVKVEQIDHAFYFGAHIFNYGQLGKKEWNDRYKELYGTLFNSATVAFYWRTLEKYPYAPRFEERYEDTENFWNNCPQPKEQDHWRRPAVDPVINYCRARGVRIHGHPLMWGNNAWMRPTWIWDMYCPESEKRALEARTGVKVPSCNWRIGMGTRDMANAGHEPGGWCWAWNQIYKQLSEDEIAAIVPTFIANYKKFYEKRFREIGERYGALVDSWDVVNESATDYSRHQGEKAVRGGVCQKSVYGLMPADYTYWGFQWAMKYMPKTAWLNLNDYNMAPYFFKQAKDLEANGCRVDVVGSQMHLFNPAESVRISQGVYRPDVEKKTSPKGVWETFATLSKAEKPIHLSEITITAPDNSLHGQMVQAIIMRNLYRIWFSIERMCGITWWNVVDDCGAPGEPSISGIFTRDMRPKTAYFAMDDLINREWKTRCEVKVEEKVEKIGGGGQRRTISFRGFRGRYRLTWKGADGKEQAKIVEVR